jgi:hypothetical protein
MTSPSAPAVPPIARLPDRLIVNGANTGREVVSEQLERILSSPVFRNSKRYAAVLTYIVEQTLAGNAEQLKERTIGVDVFGREPDYDTASDHVVRSAMAEVRKRLAQYYQGNNCQNELHLELQPGSYVPQFRSMAVPVALEGAPARVEEHGPRYAPKLRWLAVGSAAGILLISAGLLFRARTSANDAVANFWGPVLRSPGPILLCIGNLEGGKAAGSYASPSDLGMLSMGDFHHLPSQTIHVSDAIALAKFAGFLEARNKSWRIAAQSEANFGDLRNGPAILIGLMNNDWTERLVGSVRYRAQKIAPRKVAIRDMQNPSKEDWSMDYSTPLLSVTRDYALVLRVFDPNTAQTVVTAAGISIFGTLAAAEFLTDPGELRALNGIAAGWEKKNLEIVLSTEVVRAKSGRPRIVAAQVW